MEPVPLVGNESVCEISARVQNCESASTAGRFRVTFSVPASARMAAPMSLPSKFIQPAKYPNKFAQARRRYSDKLSSPQNPIRGPGLFFVVAHNRSNEPVGIWGNLHFFPVQPASAASLISSIVAVFADRSENTNEAVYFLARPNSLETATR
jgi:hypothetical protein